MAKKYYPSGKLISDMTPGEVRDWLRPHYKNTEVTRSIIMAEVEEIRSGNPRQQRTLRGFWYATVKPALSQAGLLNKKTSNDTPVDWASDLSTYIAELVRAGETSYPELNIVDNSRRRQRARALSAPVIEVDMVGAHYPYLILFTEKDTIYGVLQALADLYGVSVVSGKGQPALSCTDHIVREIIASDAFQGHDKLTLLAMADYDPSGDNIAVSQFDQIEETAHEINKDFAVDFKRIGIHPAQLKPQELKKSAYEYKDPESSQALEWYERTGGINGKKLGLELDALTLPRLREIFAREIERHIDKSKRENDLREAVIDIMACELLTPEFERKRKAMIEGVKDSQTWKDIKDLDLPDDLFRKAARQGWITPSETKELFRDYLEAIRDEMDSAL